MLERNIAKLGLSDKEAKVYLASLGLGPSPVQLISQKAKVNRATTYVVIDSLMEMGLMSTYEMGKKTFFTAESPDRLLDYLESKENKIKNKIQTLLDIMPELKSIANVEDKPKVKYFEGVEGLKAVQNDFIDTLREGETIYTFLPYDYFYQSNLKENFSVSRKKRISKKIKMKVIYTSKLGRNQQYEENQRSSLKEYLYVDNYKYPFQGGMNIYGGKIFMIDYQGKMGGIVIENKTLAEMLTVFFNLVWNCYQK